MYHIFNIQNSKQMSAFWNIFATDKEEIPELSKEEKKIFELELNFRNLLLDQNKLNNEINELKIKVKQLEVKVSQLYFICLGVSEFYIFFNHILFEMTEEFCNVMLCNGTHVCQAKSVLHFTFTRIYRKPLLIKKKIVILFPRGE